MKRLILLLALLVIYSAGAMDWEKTTWKNESPCRLLSMDGDKILIAATSSGGANYVLKLSVDKGNSWTELKVEGLDTMNLSGYISGNNIYAHWKAGAWRFAASTDLGKTWNSAPNGFPVGDRAISVQFIGDKAIATVYGTNGGMFVSSDGGMNWVRLNSKSPLKYAKFGEFLVVGGYIIAATDQGAFRTTDLGDTWEDLGAFPVLIRNIKSVGKLLFSLKNLNTYSSLLLSVDSGRTWQSISVQTPGKFTPRKFAIVKEKLFLASYKQSLDGPKAQLFMSTDLGATWTARNADPFNATDDSKFNDYSESLIVNANNRLYISTDLGESWATSITGLPAEHFTISDLKFGNNVIYANLGNEIYVSEDELVSWSKRYGALNYGSVVGLASIGDTLFAACEPKAGYTTYLDALYYSTDRGESWRRSGFIGDTIKSVFAGDGKLFIKTPTNGFISTDRGASWSNVMDVWTGNWLVDIVAFGPGKIYTGHRSDGARISSDNGVTWELRNNGLDASEKPLLDLKFEDGSLYAMTGDRIYFSSDDGAHWSKRETGVEVEADPWPTYDADGDEAYIAYGPDLYYGPNHAQNWIKTKPIDPNLNILSFWALKIVGDYVIVSLSGYGVFLSPDKGVTWKPINDGLDTESMAQWSDFIQIGDYIYCYGSKFSMAAGDIHAIYRAKLEDLISTPYETPVSSLFEIAPNPSYGWLTIRNYSGSDFEFTVTNLLGGVALSGRFTGGRMDVSRLPAGTYFLRIGDRVEKFVKI